MKNAKFSAAQIMAILRQAENGVPVCELCREQYQFLQVAIQVRRARFGGMYASMMSEMKALAEENRRLKRMYAEMSIMCSRPSRLWQPLVRLVR